MAHVHRYPPQAGHAPPPQGWPPAVPAMPGYPPPMHMGYPPPQAWPGQMPVPISFLTLTLSHNNIRPHHN